MKNYFKLFGVMTLLVLTSIVFTQVEVLTKVSGGTSWESLSIELSPTSGYTYVTDNHDYTFIDRNNGPSKSILLHDGTPGQDNPPHGMIINIVNRSNTALVFSCGGACGYESISGSFTSASITANSSLVIQWNDATSRWYEIL